MIEFWEKVKKVHFWTLFAQIWANKNVPQKYARVNFYHLYCSPLTSCTISEKTNDWILRKGKKSPFLDPFCPNLGKREFSQKNWAPSLFSLYAPLTSCKISKKSNEPIQRKVGLLTDRQTDRQHSFHRTFRLCRGSKKRWSRVIVGVKKERTTNIWNFLLMGSRLQSSPHRWKTDKYILMGEIKHRLPIYPIISIVAPQVHRQILYFSKNKFRKVVDNRI